MISTLDKWDVDDATFWASHGRRVAQRNLWVSIPNLLCAFAVWQLWSIVIVRIQTLHDAHPELFAFRSPGGETLSGDAYQALLYLLPAVAGLAGATLRIPNAFAVGICGGRNVKAMTTLLLLLPALGTGIALQNPATPFFTFVILAALSGVGGGAFASSMSNISFFFPKRLQGLALGLNAGLGNLGVSLLQFLGPYVIAFGLFDGLGVVPHPGPAGPVWIQNAALVWVPVLGALAIVTWLAMNNLPQHGGGSTGSALVRFLWLEFLGFVGAAAGIVLLLRLKLPEAARIVSVMLVTILVTLWLMRFCTPGSIRDNLLRQFAVFRNRHNWLMTLLYVMTFGSFIGFAAAFPKLITDVFGYVRVDAARQVLEQPRSAPQAPDALAYAFLGALVGSLARPLGGWLSDRFGGARVTHWGTLWMVASACGAGWCIGQARSSPTPDTYFVPFLLLFLLLFVTTGIGNGSVFRMVPCIFPKEQAGPVLGWISAMAAYGAFLIPTVFSSQIRAGTPEYAVYGFVVYYVVCLGVNWWFYARRGAEIRC